MKKIVSLAFALCVASAAMAGDGNGSTFFSFGVKAGLASEKMRIEGVSIDNIRKAVTGYHAGIVMRLEFPGLPVFAQPELLYNWAKLKSADSPDNIGDVRLNTFNVPLLLGFGIGSSNLVMIRANAGPVLNLVSNVKISEADSEALKNAFRRSTVTWAAGIGIDVMNIMLDLRYNGYFQKREVSDGEGGTFISRPQSWTLSLGYLF